MITLYLSDLQMRGECKFNLFTRLRCQHGHCSDYVSIRLLLNKYLGTEKVGRVKIMLVSMDQQGNIFEAMKQWKTVYDQYLHG